MRKILCISNAGPNSLDTARLKELTRDIAAEITLVMVDRDNKKTSAREIRRALNDKTWDLVIQEGSGLAGGLNLIAAARQRGQRYIISTGDPISGYFSVVHGEAYGAAMSIFERLLYRNCAAFVGWTPYLTGRAMSLGARRAVTVEGGADLSLFTPLSPNVRSNLRDRFGLAKNDIVCGVVGSLRWVSRQQYCYGLELVETLKRVQRSDLSVLIVGDGDGLEQLKSRVPEDLKKRIVFTGRLPAADVALAMNAMDIGFITQTLDGLGSYRLTTKLPEYLGCGLPVAMSPIPGYFDYVSGAGWHLPALHPASSAFHKHCAAWLDTLTHADIDRLREPARQIAVERFDYRKLAHRFHRFVDFLLDDIAP